MKIDTVVLKEHSYLVNGEISVPLDSSNRDYGLIQDWIYQGNTPRPEFTTDQIKENAQLVINSESISYLNSTDWYIVRHAETGEAVPPEVTKARTDARNAVID